MSAKSAGLAPAAAVAVLGAGGCDGGAAPAAGGDAVDGAAPALRFTTLAPSETGLDVEMTSGGRTPSQILEVNGGGFGLIDYDRDGDLDVFVANGASLAQPDAGPGSRLYENLGGLRFADVTAAAGIELKRWAMGVAVGDADGDGWDDLYVTCFGPNALLRNAGGRFEDVTAEAAVGDPRWGTSAAFGDLDGDGDLDLYVVNYLRFDVAQPPGQSRFKGIAVMAGPHGLPPQADVVYENLGDGTFRDVTAESGCGAVAAAYGLGVVILDFDLDGRQDVFVGNDSMQNFLFRNLGQFRFEEVGAYSGVAANADGGEQATMGIAVGDVDGNGYPDLFTSNFSSDTNTLHLNLDGEFFADRTMQYGLGLVSRPFLGWSCAFADFDLDGDEDLLTVNGHVYPEATMRSMDSTYEQPPLLFAREGDRFRRVTDPAVGAFVAERHRDRAAVFADLDGDGDVDVVVGELNGPIRLLRNDCPGGHWLAVALDDPTTPGNRRGLGARVEVRAGDRVQRRWLHTGGYQSSPAPVAHFGLPESSAVTVEITWPDGGSQRVEDVAPDQHLLVTRGPARG